MAESTGSATRDPSEPVIIDLRDDAGAEPRLLEQVAMVLGSTLELREVLRRLAHMGEEVSGARHCSVFLLDGRDLVPAVSVGRQPDEATWAAFRAMGPIHLDPRRYGVLDAGRPLAVRDARRSDLIPPRWREQFDLGAVVLVPLLAEGRPCGLMALDWAEPRAFTPDEITVLGAIGTYAGFAVGNARLFDATRRRARLQETLFRGAGALAEPLTPEEIADRLADACRDLIGARLCTVTLFDMARAHITTIASRGTRPIAGPIRMGDIPDGIVSRVWRHWERVKEPVELGSHPWLDDIVGARDAGVDWYLLVPLVVEGHSRGGALLGFEAFRRISSEERGAVEALAAMASSALERCTLVDRLERRVSQLDALYRASAVLTEGGDAQALVARVNDLLSGHGFDVVGLAFGDERLARHLRAPGTTGEEVAAWTRNAPIAELDDGSLALPVRLGGRIVGSLRVRGSLDAQDVSLLETLSRGLAELADRDTLRAELQEAAVDRALAEDRQRMATDLHASVGHALLTTGLLARDLEGEVSGPAARVVARIAELAEHGKREIDEAARALAFFPSARRGLLPSLRALAADVQADSEIEITVETAGEVARLDPSVERVLVRVAHEAFSNAWRHGKCTSIETELGYASDSVQLSVRDDGSGCGLDEACEGVGLGGLRWVVEGMGGSLTGGDHPAGGFRVVASLPRELDR